MVTAQFNPFAPGVHANPYPMYRRLREEDPVHWSDLMDAWVLSRYADTVAVLTDADRFSANRRQARNRFARLEAEGALLRDRDREVPLPLFARARPVRGCRRWTPGNLLVIRDGVTRRRCAVSAAGMRHWNSR